MKNIPTGVKCNILYAISNLNASGDNLRKKISSDKLWKIVLDNLSFGSEEVKKECGLILRNFTYCGTYDVIKEFYLSNREVRSPTNFYR